LLRKGFEKNEMAQQIKYFLTIHVHKFFFFLLYASNSEYLSLFTLSPHADGWKLF